MLGEAFEVPFLLHMKHGSWLYEITIATAYWLNYAINVMWRNVTSFESHVLNFMIDLRNTNNPKVNNKYQRIHSTIIGQLLSQTLTKMAEKNKKIMEVG